MTSAQPKRSLIVGGGHGKIISEILTKNAGMRGVLFDLPHAFEGGKNTIAQGGLTDRCEIISENFLTPFLPGRISTFFPA